MFILYLETKIIPAFLPKNVHTELPTKTVSSWWVFYVQNFNKILTFQILQNRILFVYLHVIKRENIMGIMCEQQRLMILIDDMIYKISIEKNPKFLKRYQKRLLKLRTKIK